MNRLPSVIGPAPSEVPMEEFIIKLRKERQRIVNSIELWKKSPPKKGKTKRASGLSNEIIRAAMEAGISPEELELMLKEAVDAKSN